MDNILDAQAKAGELEQYRISGPGAKTMKGGMYEWIKFHKLTSGINGPSGDFELEDEATWTLVPYNIRGRMLKTCEWKLVKGDGVDGTEIVATITNMRGWEVQRACDDAPSVMKPGGKYTLMVPGEEPIEAPWKASGFACARNFFMRGRETDNPTLLGTRTFRDSEGSFQVTKEGKPYEGLIACYSTLLFMAQNIIIQ